MLNRTVTVLQIWLTATLLGALRNRSPDSSAAPGADHGSAANDEADRGDVPGWVMITMMTAIVVIALLAVFRTAVINAVTNAFNSITGNS